MPDLAYYKNAQKLGQKEYRSCVAQGDYPYLPVLDELVNQEQLAKGKALGTMQIPAEFVVGTRSSGRTNVFARNFMPLAPENSEFAAKWAYLCQAHLEEGIRDPVKVYEYMNRYYVEEGNKRVSVLKYFQAVDITADVIRILPERNGAEETERYFELLDFFRCSKVNYVEFTKAGSFQKLQQLVGKQPAEPWTDEDRRGFSAAYHYFRQAYEACGGKKLSSTVGDAMLAYMEIYGYRALLGKTAAEIKKSVTQVWEEIALQQEQTPIDVKLDPAAERPEGLLSKVLPKGDKPLKVAFVHDKTPSLSGWTNGHERGRRYVQETLGEAVETTAYYGALDGEPQTVLEKAVADGNTVIFATSPRLLPACLRVAVEHPKITVLACSLNQSHRYIRTYYARMYEAKFIAGVIAGVLANGDNVGYICDYPIFGQVAGINAFAMGVQSVNPRTEVYLEWSSVGDVAAATKRLTDRGIRLISSQDLTRLRDDGRTPFGLSIVTENGPVHLARPLWQWGTYYEAILRRIRDKSFRTEYAESSRALNYYWGMSAGVVEMQYSDKLPDSTRKLAHLMEQSIRTGLCEPFHGPLYDQSGRKIVGDDEALSPEQVIDMSWLNENVVGSIPSYDDLTPTGKATVDQVGVGPSIKRAAGQT